MRQGTALVTWQLVYTKAAQKDAHKLAAAGLKDKTLVLLGVLEVNPFQNPSPYEKLVGDLAGAYSRRINIQHRLVIVYSEAGEFKRLTVSVSQPVFVRVVVNSFSTQVETVS